MAVPTFVAVSTTPGDGIGDVSPTIPVGTADGDVMLLFIQTNNQAVPSTPTGWTFATNGQQNTGTAAAAGATRLTVYWKRFVTGDAAPATGDSGDHQYAVIASYSGCVGTGTPFTPADGRAVAATTAVTLFGLTSTQGDCKAVTCIAGGADAATARLSAQACSTWVTITERFDAGTIAGNGGGLAITDADAATAQANANFTATIVSQAYAAWHCYLLPLGADASRVPTLMVPRMAVQQAASW